jgi:nitrogen fixation protein
VKLVLFQKQHIITPILAANNAENWGGVVCKECWKLSY